MSDQTHKNEWSGLTHVEVGGKVPEIFVAEAAGRCDIEVREKVANMGENRVSLLQTDTRPVSQTFGRHRLEYVSANLCDAEQLKHWAFVVCRFLDINLLEFY